MWRTKKDQIRQQSAETMDQLAEATRSKGASSPQTTVSAYLGVDPSSSPLGFRSRVERFICSGSPAISLYVMLSEAPAMLPWPAYTLLWDMVRSSCNSLFWSDSEARHSETTQPKQAFPYKLCS